MMSRRTLYMTLGCAALFLCFCTILLTAGLLVWLRGGLSPDFSVLPKGVPAPDEIYLQPVTDTDSLHALQSAVVLPANAVDIAARYKGLDLSQIQPATPAPALQVGATTIFYAVQQDTSEAFRVSARLVYVGANSYFWVQENLAVDESVVKQVVDTFEQSAYPTDRRVFGSEPQPGIDGDTRLHILYAQNLGSAVGGYFDNRSAESALAHPYSNEHEMFFISADNIALDSTEMNSVLAHEFQHLIHWNMDANEETWSNEGASMLAELLNGYNDRQFSQMFLQNPDVQLNSWDAENPIPHYGAAFLYWAYFYGRFGEAATTALVLEPQNGFAGVNSVLSQVAPGVTADQLFADWTAANYLHDKINDPTYQYAGYATFQTLQPVSAAELCGANKSRWQTVSQYATDYLLFNCPQAGVLHFRGTNRANILPVEPEDGEYFIWSHRNDNSDTRLTRQFDLRGTANATLQYQAYWQLEEGYDYTYLAVSTDGIHWSTLQTTHTTQVSPNGNNLGNAYNGESGSWVSETVDLSAYAGQEIWLRWEYITDAAYTAEGFALDNVAIPEIGFYDDFEKADATWQMEGFVRIGNWLPQSWILQVWQAGQLQRVVTDADGMAEIPLSGETVVMVSALSPVTRQVGTYELRVK